MDQLESSQTGDGQYDSRLLTETSATEEWWPLQRSSNLTNLSVVLDSCGRPQGTRFSNTYHESIWLTRVTFQVFLIIGTLGNVVGIILVLNERHDGRRRGNRALDTSRSRKVFLLALFISDLCYLWIRLILLHGIELWNLQPEKEQLYNSFFTWTHGMWSFLDSLLSFSSQGTSLIVVGLIYSAGGVCSLILPVLYYWALYNGKLKSQETVPRPPLALLRWRIFDAWFEVLIRITSAVTIIVLNRLIFVKLDKSHLKLAVHFENGGGNSHGPDKDAELKCIMPKVRAKTSRHAVMILLSSSIFCLVTNSLETVLSFISVLSLYPVCLMQQTVEMQGTVEAARDFLRHAYFAFSFLFYVCLKLNFQERFRNSSFFGNASRRMTRIH